MAEQPKAGLSRRGMLGLGLAAAGATLATGCRDHAPEVTRETEHWDEQFDLVIAGSGGAGVSAAIEGRRQGLQVLLLEMLPKLGGSSGMSGGVIYLGGGTPLQKACGFNDTEQAMYDYIAQAGTLHPQLDKIARYCEGSLEHFDWLVANGVHYNTKFSDAKGLPGDDSSLYYSGNETIHPFREQIRVAPRGHVPGAPGWTGGKFLMQALLASAQQLGVVIRTQASSERLIQHPDGEVLGLLYRDEQNRTHRIRARRGVVLACGGFIHNREMAQRFCPELYDCSVPWANAGDLGIGIQMGIAAGAEALRMHQGFAIMPLYQPDHVLKGIVVNRHGQRFAPEDSYHAFVGHAIAYQQGGIAYLITDRQSHYGYEDHRTHVVAEAATIAELGQRLGMAPGMLEQSVEYYNRYARDGVDPLFHKDKKFLAPLEQGPFYAWDMASKTSYTCAHTFGGLHTDVHARVINSFGDAIPGLYAAGRTSAGLPTAPYIASGISVGDATFFGRMAARHAATQRG